MVVTVLLYAKPIKTTEMLKKELDSLKPAQQELLVKSYIYGEPHDAGHTLGGIAWIESNFKMGVANPREGRYGTYGIYQSKVEDVLVRNNLKPTKENVENIRKLLSTDLKFAARDAVTELKAWERLHVKQGKVNTYRSKLASYNAGTKGPNTAVGKAYAADVARRAVLIKHYLASNPHLIAKYSNS